METPIIERSMKQTDDAIAILKDVSALCEKAIAQRDELRALVRQIQDALGTGEEGENLVAVARDAHHAEMAHAAAVRASEDADELYEKLKG